jgi:acyl-CoA dehydrogenase
MVDFSIEPEFQAKLDWMREFVENKVKPLQYIFNYDMDAAWDIENKPLRKIVRHLQQEVKDNGMWAAHLPPHLGGQALARSS